MPPAYTTIVKGDDRVYRFGSTDFVWTCRMLYGEGGADVCVDREGTAILWTMINRFALLWPKYETFTRFIRAYSQPINPKFLHGGSRDPDPLRISDRELRRAATCAMNPADMPETLTRYVRGVMMEYDTVVPGGDMVGLGHFYDPCYYWSVAHDFRVHEMTEPQVNEACRTAVGGSKSEGLIWQQPAATNPRSNAFYRVRRTRSWKYGYVRVGR